MFGREKTVDLCGRCAALYAEHYELNRVSGGVNNKVECSACGRKHYGGTYRITKRQKKDAP